MAKDQASILIDFLPSSWRYWPRRVTFCRDASNRQGDWHVEVEVETSFRHISRALERCSCSWKMVFYSLLRVSLEQRWMNPSAQIGLGMIRNDPDKLCHEFSWMLFRVIQVIPRKDPFQIFHEVAQFEDSDGWKISTADAWRRKFPFLSFVNTLQAAPCLWEGGSIGEASLYWMSHAGKKRDDFKTGISVTQR